MKEIHHRDVSQREALWMLVALMSVAIAMNIIWIAQDHTLPLWDMAGHSYRAARYADLIQHGKLMTLFRDNIIYPPLTYVAAAIGFLMFGWHVDIPQYSLLLYLVLSVVALYRIAFLLYHRRDVALLASFLLIFYPIVAHFTRIFDLDFPQTALVSVALWFLLETRRFAHARWTMAFSLACSAAILVKWTAIIFLLGPVAYVVIELLREKATPQKTAALWNIIFAGVIFSLFMVPWYSLHAVTILKIAYATRHNIFSVPYENLMSLGNMLYYVEQYIRGMAWPQAVMVGVGIALMFRRRKWSDVFILIWIFVPTLLMTFLFYSKESRYLLAAYPALALGAASLLTYRMHAVVRGGILVSSVVIALFFWTETSWGVRAFSGATYRALHLQKTYGYVLVTPHQAGLGFTSPKTYRHNMRKIIHALGTDIQKTDCHDDRNVAVAVIPNSIFLTAVQIQYLMVVDGYDRIDQPCRITYDISSRVREEGWKEVLPHADYILVKTGDQGPLLWRGHAEDAAKEERRYRRHSNNISVFQNFQVIGHWKVKGIEVTLRDVRLYKKMQ